MRRAAGPDTVGRCSTRAACQSPAPVHMRAQDNAQETLAVEKVMADFHAAVVAHDGARVTSLSVAEGSTWFTVLSDEAFAAAKRKNPVVRMVTHSSFAKL